MNEKILKLLELLKIYNGGEISIMLEDEFKTFSDTSSYEIETIEDLIEVMETEMSYWGE